MITYTFLLLRVDTLSSQILSRASTTPTQLQSQKEAATEGFSRSGNSSLHHISVGMGKSKMSSGEEASAGVATPASTTSA